MSLEAEIKNEVAKTDSGKGLGQRLFAIQSANKWIERAKLRPQPTKLYYEFWFKGELCILFADTNLGKSILAVQIATTIAQDEPVCYFDFELSDKQFENRYSENYSNHYVFPDNFFRAEIDPEDDFEGFGNFDDYLISCFEKVIIETGIRILIIDNITYLKNETEKAKYALPLMKKLKALKKKYDLSILVLAHTPKRDLSKPITQNDLQGSKMLINFCDSSFAIGASSQDKELRYLKQIKQRNTEQIYDADNVVSHRITKKDSFLKFEFVGYGCEREHLKQVTEADRENNTERAKELSNQGKSQRQIAKELNISVSTVNKYLNLSSDKNSSNGRTLNTCANTPSTTNATNTANGGEQFQTHTNTNARA